jgi:hypothetical protein
VGDTVGELPSSLNFDTGVNSGTQSIVTAGHEATHLADQTLITALSVPDVMTGTTGAIACLHWEALRALFLRSPLCENENGASTLT